MTNESEIKMHNSNHNNNTSNSNSITESHRIIPVSAKIPLDNNSISTSNATTIKLEEQNGHNGSQPAQSKAIEATIELLIEKVELEVSEPTPEPRQENGTSDTVPVVQEERPEVQQNKPESQAEAVQQPREQKQEANKQETELKGDPAKQAPVVVQDLDMELDDNHEEPKVYVDLTNLTRSSQQSSATEEANSAMDTTTNDDTKLNQDDESSEAGKPKQSRKRQHEAKKSMTSDNETPQTEGRSKRQRTQTKLFQVVATTSASTRASSGRSSVASGSYTISPAPKSTASRKSNAHAKPKATQNRKSNARQSSSSSKARSSRAKPQTRRPQQEDDEEDELPPQLLRYDQTSNDLHNVIYEKNDILAIRNETDTFYLCQLAENVRVLRPTLKIRWLDTNDDGKTYFLTSQYDSIPQKSIIMPVTLEKLKREKKKDQIFTLDDQTKDNIMERLKRSLILEAGMHTSSQESEQNATTTATTEQAN